MMKVTWETHMGPFHKIVTEDEVMEFLGNLAALGFTGTVDIVDEK